MTDNNFFVLLFLLFGVTLVQCFSTFESTRQEITPLPTDTITVSVETLVTVYRKEMRKAEQTIECQDDFGPTIETGVMYRDYDDVINNIIKQIE